MRGLLPKFPARELARIVVQDARFPQPEIVMALDAPVMSVFNTLAPGTLDLVLGQSVPFLEGLRKGASRGATGGEGNLRQPRG
jgi:hypothetical protein